MGPDRWRRWQDAMQDALYGPEGFYRASGAPARHFRTSAHTSPAWSTAIARLVSAIDDRMGRPDTFWVVDMGAGGGEVLAALSLNAPSRWRLVGVDVAQRPATLPAQVEWRGRLPDAFEGVLLAVEWLDVVAVDCVELTGDGPRLLEVSDTGDERLADAPPEPDMAWLQAWWPLAAVGDRGEIGLPRDEAWAAALRRLGRGLAVVVDYGADPRRDVAGTLTGYRDGRQHLPVPDGSMDLTAHVLFESLPREGDRARLLTQREALLELGLSGARPSYESDPVAYVAALSHAGAEAELLARGGLGDHRWLMIERGLGEET